MSGNGFDLETTLAGLESKVDGLGQKVTLGERRLEAKLELLRVDLIEAFMDADPTTPAKARTDRDQRLDALRGEPDALGHRIEALERG